jgi:hypothetical protein
MLSPRYSLDNGGGVIDELEALLIFDEAALHAYVKVKARHRRSISTGAGALTVSQPPRLEACSAMPGETH